MSLSWKEKDLTKEECYYTRVTTCACVHDVKQKPSCGLHIFLFELQTH